MESALVRVLSSRILQSSPVRTISNIGVCVIISSSGWEWLNSDWRGRSKRSRLAFRHQGACGRKCFRRWSGVSYGTGPRGGGRSLVLGGGRRRKKRRCLRLERANVEWNRRGYCRGRDKCLSQIACQKDPPNSKNRNDTNPNRDQKCTVEWGTRLHI